MPSQLLIDAYDFLPGFFKLAETTWGISLMTIEVVPQMFIVFTSLVFIFASLLNIHGPERGVYILKGGIMTGGLCIFIGMGISCLTSCLSIVLSPAVTFLALLLPIIGLLILGVILISATHSVYDAAC